MNTQPTIDVHSKRGKRPTQEDGFVSFTIKYPNGVRDLYMCYIVIDGHGGRSATNYLIEHFPGALTATVQEVYASGGTSSMSKALQSCFDEVNAAFLAERGATDESGACVTAAIYKLDTRQLWVAYTGDCRAYVESSGEVIPLTDDHKPTRPDELKRIHEADGFVCYDRLVGSLAVSRAFGDEVYIQYGLIATPDVMCCTITKDNAWLFLCTDGVTDRCTPEDILATISASSESAAEELVSLAISKGSNDNCTAMVVSF